MALLIDTQIRNDLYATGSIEAGGGFTGSLHGTASVAISASWAPMPDIPSSESSSWASSSLSSSYSDYAITASYISGSVAFNPSFVYEMTASNAVSASWAPMPDIPSSESSSWASSSLFSNQSTYSTSSLSSSFASSSISSSHALTASFIGNGTNNYVPVWQNNTLSATSSITNISPTRAAIGTNNTSSAVLTLKDNGEGQRYLDCYTTGSTAPGYEADIQLSRNGILVAGGSDYYSFLSRNRIFFTPIPAVVEGINLSMIGDSYIDTNHNFAIGTSTVNAFKLEVKGHVGPNIDSIYDLGSTTYKWGQIYANGITGSLFGTSSWADKSIHAITASFAEFGIGGMESASYAFTASYMSGSLFFENGIDGYFPMWSANTLTDSSSLYWSESRVGIGITNPLTTLHVQGDVTATSFTGSLNIVDTLTGSAKASTSEWVKIRVNGAEKWLLLYS